MFAARGSARAIAAAAFVAGVAGVGVLALVAGHSGSPEPARPGPHPEAQAGALVRQVFDRTRRLTACRPPRNSGGAISDAAPAPATLRAFRVLRTERPAPKPLLDAIAARAGPGAVVLSRTVRVLGTRAVLFVVRAPFGGFLPRDPVACAHAQRDALSAVAADASAGVRDAARHELERAITAARHAQADQRDRLFLYDLVDGSRLGSGGGGGTAEEVGRRGMGSSATIRTRAGERARLVEGIVPDHVATVEVITRGGGGHPRHGRHAAPVLDNYFRLAGFHAASFRTVWRDARGRALPRR